VISSSQKPLTAQHTCRNQAAAVLHLRPHCHQHRQNFTHTCNVIKIMTTVSVRICAFLDVASCSFVDRQCFVWRLCLYVQGRMLSLNRMFYFTLLHFFPSSFLLPTHPSTPSSHCPLSSPSPVSSLSAPILLILSNGRRNYFSSSENIQPWKNKAAYFSETHTCLPKNVHGVTCQMTVAAADIQRLV